MPTYGFSKDAMLAELKSILMTEANIAGRFFHPSAARALFGLEPGPNPIRYDELDISDLHITRVFSLLYDFVMNAEWDMFGNLLHPSSMRIDVTGFVQRAIAAFEFEMDFGEFAVGGEDGAIDRGLCVQIARAAAGRIKLWDPDDECYELTVQELAAVAHVDERTVRNAASELAIQHDEIGLDAAETWLASRRMYRPVRKFDSIDEIDTQTFATFGHLVAFIAERCIARGVDEPTFTARVGWPLEDLLPTPTGEAVDPIFEETGGILLDMELARTQRIDITKLDQTSWQRIAELIEVNWVWLLARVLRMPEVFHKLATTIWYQRAVWQLRDAHQATQKEPRILVPIASDGTWFHAGLRRRKGFLIGGKRDKRYIADFFKALEALKSMPHAYWHRPNPQTGLWGVVKALSWKEMPETQVLAEPLEQMEGNS